VSGGGLDHLVHRIIIDDHVTRVKDVWGIHESINYTLVVTVDGDFKVWMVDDRVLGEVA